MLPIPRPGGGRPFAMAGDRERPLSGRDKLVGVCIALVLIAIVASIFRLGIAVLYG